MLTREEQAKVFRAAQALARLSREMRRQVDRAEISPRAARERVEEAEDDFRDLLKEIG
jgi:hypothetical protein